VIPRPLNKWRSLPPSSPRLMASSRFRFLTPTVFAWSLSMKGTVSCTTGAGASPLAEGSCKGSTLYGLRTNLFELRLFLGFFRQIFSHKRSLLTFFPAFCPSGFFPRIMRVSFCHRHPFPQVVVPLLPLFLRFPESIISLPLSLGLPLLEEN